MIHPNETGEHQYAKVRLRITFKARIIRFIANADATWWMIRKYGRGD